MRQSSAFPALTHTLHDEGNVPRHNVNKVLATSPTSVWCARVY
jgi:hypothetical protein